MRSFHVKIALLFLFIEAALTAHAQQARSLTNEISALSVKYAGVHLKGEKEIEWRYPYFVGAKNLRIERLNAWLRERSIDMLFPAGLGDRDIKAKDSVLIDWLRDSEDLRTASAELARIGLSQVFGHYFVFTFDGAWTDDASYRLDIGSRVFDYATGSEVETASLFRPGAREAFDEILDIEIRKVLSASKRDYLNCVKKKRGSCIDPEIDVAVCVEHTNFSWQYLQIVNSRHMLIEYPYRPSLHQLCGAETGFELKGRKVEQLLIEPGAFRRGRGSASFEKRDR